MTGAWIRYLQPNVYNKTLATSAAQCCLGLSRRHETAGSVSPPGTFCCLQSILSLHIYISTYLHIYISTYLHPSILCFSWRLWCGCACPPPSWQLQVGWCKILRQTLKNNYTPPLFPQAAVGGRLPMRLPRVWWPSPSPSPRC